MADWPGEKLRLYDVGVLAGTVTAFELFNLDFAETPDETVTLTSGNDFYLLSHSTRLLRDGDAIGTCNWILEVAEGGAAEIYTSRDVDWDGVPGPWELAAMTVSAGRTVVPLPLEDRTIDWLSGDAGGLLLRVRVTSGSVTLASVRLQVEPPGGLLMRTGWQWSEYQTPGPILATASVGGGGAGSGYYQGGILDHAVALDAVRAGDGNTGPGTTSPVAGVPPNSYSMFEVIEAGDPWQANCYDRAWSLPTIPPGTSAWLDVGYTKGIWRERPTLRARPDFMQATADFLEGRDWEKVSPGFGWESYGEFTDGDTEAIEWAPIGVLALPGVSTAPADSPFGATAAIEYENIYPGSTDGWQPIPGSWPPQLATQQAHHWGVGDLEAVGLEAGTYRFFFDTPPPGSDFTITVWSDLFNDGVYAGADPVDTGWVAWAVRPNVDIRYQMPDFRYRVPAFGPDPDAAAALVPRFFVKGSDGVTRPVGYGKPADEEHVFMVPTPVGLYRDMTAAEYALHPVPTI